MDKYNIRGIYEWRRLVEQWLLPSLAIFLQFLHHLTSFSTKNIFTTAVHYSCMQQL